MNSSDIMTRGLLMSGIGYIVDVDPAAAFAFTIAGDCTSMLTTIIAAEIFGNSDAGRMACWATMVGTYIAAGMWTAKKFNPNFGRTDILKMVAATTAIVGLKMQLDKLPI